MQKHSMLPNTPPPMVTPERAGAAHLPPSEPPATDAAVPAIRALVGAPGLALPLPAARAAAAAREPA